MNPVPFRMYTQAKENKKRVYKQSKKLIGLCQYRFSMPPRATNEFVENNQFFVRKTYRQNTYGSYINNKNANIAYKTNFHAGKPENA